MLDQMDLFAPRYPRAPGARRAATSRAAADHMKPRAPSLRDLILLALSKTPDLTPDEAATLLGKSVLAIRPRFSEMVALGQIAATGERRANESGLNAQVYRRLK